MGYTKSIRLKMELLEYILCAGVIDVVDLYMRLEEAERYCWYNLNRELHRNNNKPAVVLKPDTRWFTKLEWGFEYYINGRFHREHDQPAVIY